MTERAKPAGAENRFIIFGKTQLRRLFIALQFFNENGLANHAAAGAYGFLLSAVPTLLLVSFFLLAAFRSSPQSVIALVMEIPFLEIVFDEEWLTNDFLALARPGISGLISVVSIFWAGRVFAMSMQRGLKIIFPGIKKRNPLMDNLIVVLIELLALVFALVMIFCSQTALRLYGVLNLPPKAASVLSFLPKLRSRIFPIIALGLVSYCAYRIIPANSPRRSSALKGTVFCVAAYELMALVLRVLLNQARYNFLYGALGNLVVLLVNVYFFFVFFFLGAQLAFVIDSFDALLFVKLRQSRTEGQKAGPGIIQKLFFPVEGRMRKYFRAYKGGETIFSKGDGSDDIYYLLEGEVEVFTATDNFAKPAGVVQPGSFFGEMGHLLSEDRSATVRAKTDAAALKLPPQIFDDVLKYDTSLDRTIIEHLSRRLRNSNVASQYPGGSPSPQS